MVSKNRLATLCTYLHIQVEVLSGKDRGKQGRVMVVARALNRVYVEGLNTVRTLMHIGMTLSFISFPDS